MKVARHVVPGKSAKRFRPVGNGMILSKRLIWNRALDELSSDCRGGAECRATTNNHTVPYGTDLFIDPTRQ
jgi:hypothetical protein